MKTKKEYIAPELTVVTFKAELGYANSVLQETLRMLTSLTGFNAYGQEMWTEETDNLGGNGWDWS